MGNEHTQRLNIGKLRLDHKRNFQKSRSLRENGHFLKPIFCFSSNEKDGTIKITPFCSKECAESIGTVRWTLATSNVEIIDPIYIFQNCQFSTKKVIFLENGPSDRAQNWCVDARDDFEKISFEKGEGP